MMSVAMLLTVGVGQAMAQSELAKPKAMLTLSFIRYMGWSEAARQGDFVIGVIKDRELADWLKTQSEGKKFGFQNVVIKMFKSPQEAEDCQVLYVSRNVSYSRNAASLLDKVGKDTLVITEEEGSIKNGSMINFVVRDGKLRFELSKSNAAISNIQFSQKLLDMTAAIVM